VKYQQDRFTITAFGTVTLKVPVEEAKGARFMVAIKSAKGREIGTRPFLSFEGANKIYDRLAARVKVELPTAEHLNA